MNSRELLEFTKQNIFKPIDKTTFSCKKNFIMTILGKTQKGKSYLCLKLYDKYFKKKFDGVILISGNGDTRDEYEEHIPGIKVYKDSIDEKETNLLFKEVVEDLENRDKKDKLLVIIEDHYQQNIQRNAGLIHMFTEGRHWNTSLIFIVQYDKVAQIPIMRAQTHYNIIFESQDDMQKNVINKIADIFKRKTSIVNSKLLNKFATELYNEIFPADSNNIGKCFMIYGNDLYLFPSKKKKIKIKTDDKSIEIKTKRSWQLLLDK